MNGSSKILTVSYGTFSCTLEGFDDPLGTMRELAEYFRDLAADDRYFGAEPPTPDVEMLQNIAQRDVHRKVEARPSATGIALTQVESDAPVADETIANVAEKVAGPEPTPAPAQTSDTGPLTFDDDFLMADEPEDILAVDPDAVPAVEGPAETVAEKLRRIRAVVSRRPGDESAAPFSQPQPDAGASRDRAMSETIRQIQSDLADDEDAATDEVKNDDLKTHRDNPAADNEEISAESSVVEEVEQRVDEVQPDDIDESVPSDDEAAKSILDSVNERVSDVDTPDAKPTSKPLPEGTDVGRLLEETDNKLNEDGVVRRRQVISQMRAAVAATKADRAVTRLITPEAQDEVQKKAYRNDLSDAVNTTEPMADQRKKTRTISGPPLVLVSSQRVADADAKDTEEKNPAPGHARAATNGFAEFAQLNNAESLEELLEAAAAYTVFKKGQDSFSRPEIMKHVAMVDPVLSQSREDGLRSFGQLLRQGKFQKLDRGQFTIDEGTRFNPDKRYAGE